MVSKRQDLSSVCHYGYFGQESINHKSSQSSLPQCDDDIMVDWIVYPVATAKQFHSVGYLFSTTLLGWSCVGQGLDTFLIPSENESDMTYEAEQIDFT